MILSWVLLILFFGNYFFRVALVAGSASRNLHITMILEIINVSLILCFCRREMIKKQQQTRGMNENLFQCYHKILRFDLKYLSGFFPSMAVNNKFLRGPTIRLCLSHKLSSCSPLLNY